MLFNVMLTCAIPITRATSHHTTFYRPDMTRIVRSLERISSDLGVNEHLAGLIVCSAAGNVDSLRQLGIVLSTGAQPGHQRQHADLAMVSKEGLVRGLCGVVTGEVAGELLRPCRISADGNRWNTNIDMLCNKLLSIVLPQGETLRNHANYLRCIAGLALADQTLLMAKRAPLYDGADLFRLLPIDPNSGEEEQTTLLVRKGRVQLIVEKFERAIMHSEDKYRGFFEGFLQLKSRPDKLNTMLHQGKMNILTKDSWLQYVVSERLWDGADIPADKRSVSSVDASGYEGSLAAKGPFSFLLFQIIKSFSGNSVSVKKRHGLVPFMEFLRSDGFHRYALPNVDTSEHGGNILSFWCFFQQMAEDKLGRSAVRSEVELRSFANILGACFNGGVAMVSPASYPRADMLKNADTGVVKPQMIASSGNEGTGVSLAIAVDGKYTIVKAGNNYSGGETLDFTHGTNFTHRVTVTKTSEFGLTKAAIECILHVVSGNWNSLHGIEPDLVAGQLEVDPPRAVRTNTLRGPRDTPGWKLLRATNERELPQLVVGGGRRPLLALRRLRAFIKLGSGTIGRVSAEQFSDQLPTKQSTMSTEIFALLEGSAIAAAYKVAVLSIILMLENDVESLGGIWASAPIMFSSVVQQLVKPSIDTAAADAVSKKSMQSAKTFAASLKWDAVMQTTATLKKGLAKAKELGAASGGHAQKLKSAAEKGNEILWGMVKEMVTFVKHEFDFHIPNRNDPTSQERRRRLSVLFDELPSLSTMVEGFGTRPEVTTLSVMQNAFAFVTQKGTTMLAGMLGSPDNAGNIAAAKKIVEALMGTGDDATGDDDSPKQVFGTILSASVAMLSSKLEFGQIDSVNKVAATFSSLQDSPLGSRHQSFPAAGAVGQLLSGLDFQEDAPGLAILESASFWESVYGLFLKLRDPPQSDVAEEERLEWRKQMVGILCKTCGLTVEGGLLFEVVKSLEPDKAADIFEKFNSIRTLIAHCSTQKGLMSVRERTTWFKEFARQILVGRYGAATAGTQSSQKPPSAADVQNSEGNGEHYLLGCAMFLFDLWSWVPDATNGKQLQQSMFRLRVLLKDAVQLAVELTARDLKKSNPLRKKPEQKRRIALACSLVDAAFEIPRAISGPVEEAWVNATKDRPAHWAELLIIDWDRLAARILNPASIILSAVDRLRRAPKDASANSSAAGSSMATVVETLRVLRDCKNTYGAVLDLSVALEAVPKRDPMEGITVEQRMDEIADQVTVDTGIAGADPGGAGASSVFGDGDDEEDAPAIKLDVILNVLLCLAKYLKNNRIIVPWKAKAVLRFATCILGPDVNLKALPDFRTKSRDFLKLLYNLLKLEGGATTPGNEKIMLWEFMLTDKAVAETPEAIWSILKKHDPNCSKTTETKAELYKYAGYAVDLNADINAVLAVHFFPLMDIELKRLLNNVLVGKKMQLDTLLAFFSHPLIALMPAKQVGNETLLRKQCETEAVAMVASIPQIQIAMEISEAAVSSRPTLRMVANAIDKIARYALSVDKSPEAMQNMLEEMVGDMLPRLAREHVTLPIIDSLNGRQGLVTLARSHIGATAKTARMIEMTKRLALTVGTKVFGVNEFIARRAVDVLAGCSNIQANMTHLRKLDSLTNERDLLEEAAGGVIRTGRLNGIRTTTSQYMLSVMRAIYRARWLHNSANFEHFVLDIDDNNKCQGNISARAKILLMDCRGAISSFHSALLRRVIEFASKGATWEKKKVDGTKGKQKVSGGGRSGGGSGGSGGGGGGAHEIDGNFQCPTCRTPSTILRPLFGVDQLCCICNELEVDCTLTCGHAVACQRCMLQMQDGAAGAAAAEDPNASHVFKRDFVWAVDTKKKGQGFSDPTGIRRQLGNIYERMCKLIHPTVQLAALAPWPKWEDVSKHLSDDVHDFEVLQGTPSVSSDGRLNAGGGIVRTVEAMCALSPKLKHLKRPLTILALNTISGNKLDRAVFFKVLLGISQIRVTAGTDVLKGPTRAQVESLTEDISAKDGTWPVYGSAEGLVDFIMTNSQLLEQAKVVFTERAKPEEIVALARDSLIKCLQGVHTGRDYAINLIFPVVRLMHYRYGAYGNIDLLPDLTIRKLIAAEVAKKERDTALEHDLENDDGDGGGADGSGADDGGGESGPNDEELLEAAQLKNIGSFPVFDMFGNDKKRAEKLINAVKASLFRAHADALKKANANRLGEFMVSIVRLHQQMVTSINFAANEDDDIRNLCDMFNSENGGTTPPLVDQPLLAGFALVSEMTIDHPKRMLIALIKISKYICDGEKQTKMLNSKPIHGNEGLLLALTDYVKYDKPPERVGEPFTDNAGVVHERWSVSLKTSTLLSNALGETVAITTELDVSADDSSDERNGWVTNSTKFESVALVRAWSKMLCTLLRKLWVKESADDGGSGSDEFLKESDVSADDAMQRVLSGLNRRISCARQIVYMLVLEASEAEIENFDTAYEGLRVKRILVAYYRSVLLYIWWYVDMRKQKFPWLSKMLYDLPMEARSSDESFALFVRGGTAQPETCFFGQFGILQFVRRVDYVVFNCRSSGLQRTEMTSLTQRLFELQRAFDVDLSEGRRPEAPEAVRISLAERVELTDCFAINILYTVGPFRPLVDCIYLNRRLLTGTGLQSPVAFQERYEHLAREQVSGYLRLVQRVNPLLRPAVDGQVMEKAKEKVADGDNVSMSGSMMEEFDAVDGLSAVFASARRAGAGAGAETASIGSKGSAGSMRSQAAESAESAAKRHPVMQFIPVASKLFIALARASQGVFTWDLFEKIIRTLVMESVLKVSGCALESPFSNLPIQNQLKKILECTLDMAGAESTGGESRDSALKLSGMMGRLLGLENRLVDGMLAVVDKSPAARQVALANLGAFLAKSISVGDGAPGTAGAGGGSSGANGSNEITTKVDSSMQISATISGMVALASNDFEGARQMAIKLGGFEVAKIERLFAFCSAMYKAGLRGEEVAKRLAHDPIAIVEGQLTDEKLYIAFDTDGDANMDYGEFETCTKYMTFPERLTTITAMRLFSRGDREKSAGLSLTQYKVAMAEFSDEIAEKVLAKRGLSLANNRKKLLRDTFNLMIIFLFIFVGIAAFTSAGGFESTVNALLPLAAGVGVTAGAKEETVNEQDDQDVLDDIDEAMAELTEDE